MSIASQINDYISSLPDSKQAEMRQLHELAVKIAPDAKQWYLDGTNDEGKLVTNPNIGYGTYLIEYKDGSSREFYRVGFTANTGGISVYIMGMEKDFLKDTYGASIGKATVTGYCIKFKKLEDIKLDVLEKAIRHRLEMA